MTRWILGVAVIMTHAGSGPLQAQSPSFRGELVAGGLVTPWSLAFAPDGKLFVAERSGRIRVIEGNRLAATPWAVVPAYDAPERSYETGLMGLAVDPMYPARAFVYACYTHRESDSTMYNRIVRLTGRGLRGGDELVLVDRIPAAAYHNGCRLKFGPDAKLYATTGDAQVEALGQDLGSLAGKVLRMNADGSVPSDNPFPNSLVWSLGHRNPQGLAWEPRSNRLFVTEHGTGGIDELNIVERGGNYGWPVARGKAGNAQYSDPVLVLVAAPTGAIFLTGNRYPALPPGLLAVTSLSGQRVLLIQPDSGGATIYADSAFAGVGRMRDIVRGPDGFLYVSTSNRDGRGQPASEDDRILRLLPVPSRQE